MSLVPADAALALSVTGGIVSLPLDLLSKRQPRCADASTCPRASVRASVTVPAHD